MDLDKMPLAAEHTGGFTKDVTQEPIATPENMTPQEIYTQRMRCQYEVMKLLGFLSSDFDLVPEFEGEIGVAMTLWCQNINGVKETSNAAVFDREYEAIMQNKEKSAIMRSTDPDNIDARNLILRAIADKLISKQHLVN